MSLLWVGLWWASVSAAGLTLPRNTGGGRALTLGSSGTKDSSLVLSADIHRTCGNHPHRDRRMTR